MSKLKIAKIAFISFGVLLLLFTVRLIWDVGMDAPWFLFSLIAAIICFLGAYAMSAVERELDDMLDLQHNRIEKLKKQLAAQEQKK